MGFLCGSDAKESACNVGDPGLNIFLGQEDIPWRRKWQPTPVFLPGQSHGQRSLAGYSPWGHKESDRIERLTLLLKGIVPNTLQYTIKEYNFQNKDQTTLLPP